MALGFVGSFGHCAGMCGPITVAFSLSNRQQTPPSWRQQFHFHALLNLGRIVSYALVGAGIGALGSVLIASGQLAGIDSELRHWMAILTGVMLIWFGLVQLNPKFLPHLPVLHPLKEGIWHNRLSSLMVKLSLKPSFWTPSLLGAIWGLIPCGFLYTAQLKAAETGNLWQGMATMLAFGLGTLPTMLGVGICASKLSADRRSQLFRLGGWITLTIGLLTLLRNGDMVDYTGHAALLCLMLALIARPISHLWSQPLRYRRALGVGAFVLALAHTGRELEHTLNWNFAALDFMLPSHQLSMWTGIGALVLIMPAALTSFDRMQSYLGKRWRQVHLLSVPAVILCAIHIVLIGSHYLGGLQWTWENKLATVMLGVITLGVLLIRSRWIWSLLCIDKLYVSPIKH